MHRSTRWRSLRFSRKWVQPFNLRHNRQSCRTGRLASYRKSAHQIVIYMNCNNMVDNPSCEEWSDTHRINAPPPSIFSPGCSIECHNLPPTILFWRLLYSADQHTTIFHYLTWMFCRVPGSSILYPVLKITISCRSTHHHFPFSHPAVLQNSTLLPSIVSPWCSAECQNLSPATLFWRSPTFTINDL